MRLTLLASEHLDKKKAAVHEPVPGVVCALAPGEAVSRNPKTQANEDSLAALAVEGGAAAIVADAHFGARAGEELVQATAKALESAAALGHEELGKLLLELDRAYVEGRAGDEDISETTLLVALVRKRRVVWASLADSHIYRVRGATAERLNADQSLFAGGREPISVLVVPGFCEGVESGELELAPGEILLLASDGIGEEDSGVPPEDLARALTGSGSLRERVHALVERARSEAAGGGRDNVALVAIDPDALARGR